MSQQLQEVLAEKAAMEISKRQRYSAAIRSGDIKKIAIASEEAGIARSQLELDLADFAKLPAHSKEAENLRAMREKLPQLLAEIETLREEWRKEENRIKPKLHLLGNQVEQLRSDIAASKTRVDNLNGIFLGLARRGIAIPEDIHADYRDDLVKDAERLEGFNYPGKI